MPEPSTVSGRSLLKFAIANMVAAEIECQTTRCDCRTDTDPVGRVDLVWLSFRVSEP